MFLERLRTIISARSILRFRKSHAWSWVVRPRWRLGLGDKCKSVGEATQGDVSANWRLGRVIRLPSGNIPSNHIFFSAGPSLGNADHESGQTGARGVLKRREEAGRASTCAPVKKWWNGIQSVTWLHRDPALHPDPAGWYVGINYQWKETGNRLSPCFKNQNI